MMVNRENVIKGLELCTERSLDCAVYCPYINASHDWMTCTDVLMTDALALLKEQEQKCRECGETTSKAIQELLTKLKKQEPRNALNIVKVHEGTLGNCPTCGAELMDYYNETLCGRCGQAVKWNG